MKSTPGRHLLDVSITLPVILGHNHNTVYGENPFIGKLFAPSKPRKNKLKIVNFGQCKKIEIPNFAKILLHLEDQQ